MNLAWDPPFFIPLLIAIFLTYLCSKNQLVQISALGSLWNGFLVFLQLALLLIYTVDQPFWIALPTFLLFIGIELTRLIGGRRLTSLTNELNVFAEQREHFNETFRIVRSERHEFLKHVSSIHFMLENNQNAEAKNYLNELVSGYEETNLSIKGERGVVAGVLHQMYRRAQKAGISIVYDLDIPLSSLPLSDKKVVTLVGNLLSNSIDACEEWQRHYQKQAQISLQFYKRSGLNLLICKNHSLPIPTSILDELFQTYGKTTKSGSHEGLGTKLIQDIVDENQGFLDFIYKEEEFTVKIKIPAIR
ncbi:GHKL domain-containing protein [Mesobacillus maritimus]|uniref:GHKL domain-containing protein n=2 Tax=Mesobacillus maritimus TaxID=1643336 RepID=A0ABS7K6H6_9BACI|nr:GHKL domain-containing protein [Mesobacillus maritimus]